MLPTHKLLFADVVFPRVRTTSSSANMWIRRIQTTVAECLVPALQSRGMALTKDDDSEEEEFLLLEADDTLSTIAHQWHVPMWALPRSTLDGEKDVALLMDRVQRYDVQMDRWAHALEKAPCQPFWNAMCLQRAVQYLQRHKKNPEEGGADPDLITSRARKLYAFNQPNQHCPF